MQNGFYKVYFLKKKKVSVYFFVDLINFGEYFPFPNTKKWSSGNIDDEVLVPLVIKNKIIYSQLRIKQALFQEILYMRAKKNPPKTQAELLCLSVYEKYLIEFP